MRIAVRMVLRSEMEHLAGQGDPLFEHLRQWMREEEYWILWARGSGDFDATTSTPVPG